MVEEAFFKNLYIGSQRLWTQLVAGNDINEIIQLAYDIIKRPIIINTDAVHFKSIGVRSNTVIDRLFSIKSEETVANVRSAAILSMEELGFTDPQIQTGVVHAGIFAYGDYMGRVLILGEDTPLGEMEIEYAITLAKITATVFAMDIFPQINSLVPHLPLFHSLLSGEKLDPLRVKHQLETLKIYPEKGMNFVVIDQRSRPLLSAQNNLELFRELFRSKVYALYRGNIVLLNSRSQGKGLGISEATKAQLATLGARCGVSREFYDLDKVPSYYEQALFALRVGNFFSLPDPVFEYETYSTEHIICQMSKFCDPSHLLDPRFVKLKEYDETSSNYLIETLKIHVKNVKSPTAGAAELNIHRNTYFYRLNKISEFTGWDLNDGNCIAKIAFYIKICELMDQEERNNTMSLASLIDEI